MELSGKVNSDDETVDLSMKLRGNIRAIVREVHKLVDAEFSEKVPNPEDFPEYRPGVRLEG